jgi:hypothetical protein
MHGKFIHLTEYILNEPTLSFIWPMTRALFENTQQLYQQIHISVLKLVYICSELLHVSANHVAIFGDTKYKV